MYTHLITFLSLVMLQYLCTKFCWQPKMDRLMNNWPRVADRVVTRSVGSKFMLKPEIGSINLRGIDVYDLLVFKINENAWTMLAFSFFFFFFILNRRYFVPSYFRIVSWHKCIELVLRVFEIGCSELFSPFLIKVFCIIVSNFSRYVLFYLLNWKNLYK